MSQKSYNNKPTLYLIPTPIGNMDDITIRSINTLKEVDVIFSEDTRETLKLLNYLEISKKLISCHKFNEDKVYLKVIEYLKEGKNVGLVTDRGTPVISDPGYVVAYNVIKEGFNVVGLPGATAFVPALITSGINPNKFLFYGFLDSKKSSKKKELEELKNNKYTMIFYESPFRVIETLELIKQIMGDRFVSISREISKKYEEVFRGNISDVLKELTEPKGEFVIILEGSKEEINYDDIDIVKHVNMLIKEGISEKDAIKEVAKMHKIPKNDVYMKVKGDK